TIAYQLQITRLELILSVLPHALLELTALFLPLAAWLIASRRGEWNQLLAATFITVTLAIPALVIAATVEVYVWPHILEALSPGLRQVL
ncbi:MAG TPA: stage II sporulation protein M, partial [Solirubrobacterales bacterium]|nr:stage II sporulation protein M [Solirubrobacterales bacterium]